MKLNINVTQKHIDASKRLSKCHCPIAFAVVEEAVNHGAMISARGVMAMASIDHEKGRLHFNNLNLEFPLPLKARQFIRDRDEGNPVGPFNFVATAQPMRKSSVINWAFDPNEGRSFDP